MRADIEFFRVMCLTYICLALCCVAFQLIYTTKYRTLYDTYYVKLLIFWFRGDEMETDVNKWVTCFYCLHDLRIDWSREKRQGPNF